MTSYDDGETTFPSRFEILNLVGDSCALSPNEYGTNRADRIEVERVRVIHPSDACRLMVVYAN